MSYSGHININCTANGHLLPEYHASCVCVFSLLVTNISGSFLPLSVMLVQDLIMCCHHSLFPSPLSPPHCPLFFKWNSTSICFPVQLFNISEIGPSSKSKPRQPFVVHWSESTVLDWKLREFTFPCFVVFKKKKKKKKDCCFLNMNEKHQFSFVGDFWKVK